MPTAAGIRNALDATVDRALLSRPAYTFAFLLADIAAAVLLHALGRRWSRH